MSSFNDTGATREQKLLMNLAKASCAGNQSRAMNQYFDELDNTGWFIELARTHLRLCTGVHLHHQEFGKLLQLSDGRAYRLALTRDDEVRGRMVAFCRVALKTTGPTAVTQLQKMLEYHQLQRAIAWSHSFGVRRTGRKLEECMFAVDEAGSALELLRERAGCTLKEWAFRIGTSENTYRRRLANCDIPQAWLPNAQKALTLKQQQAMTAVAQPHVADIELDEAFKTVWCTYLDVQEKLRNKAAPDMPLPNTPDTTPYTEVQEQQDMDLTTFTPSEESDSIDLSDVLSEPEDEEKRRIE